MFDDSRAFAGSLMGLGVWMVFVLMNPRILTRIAARRLAWSVLWGWWVGGLGPAFIADMPDLDRTFPLVPLVALTTEWLTKAIPLVFLLAGSLVSTFGWELQFRAARADPSSTATTVVGAAWLSGMSRDERDYFAEAYASRVCRGTLLSSGLLFAGAVGILHLLH